jgi:hypothetical protein
VDEKRRQAAALQNAVFTGFVIEILQSSNLAVAAAVLPFHSNVF